MNQIRPVSTPVMPAARRVKCFGCGRWTAVNHMNGLLWVHDRWIGEDRRLCPGSRTAPPTETA